MSSNKGLKNRLIKSSSANSVAMAARVANQLLIVPILILGWSTELFGEWLILSTIPTFLALADFGFIAAGSNELARRASQGCLEDVEIFFNRYSVYFQRWSFLLAFIIGLGSFLIPFNQLMGLELISTTDASFIFILLALSAIISQNSLSLLAGLRLKGKFHLGLLIRAFSAILQLVLTWGLVSIFNSGPVVLATSIFIVSIVFYGIEWLVLWRNGLRQTSNPLNFSHGGENMKPYLYMGFEMMLMPLAQAITLQGSIILIGKMLDPIAVATYATHRTLARLSSALLQVFTNPLRAEAGLLQKEEDKPLLTEVTSVLSRVTFWLSLVLSVCLMLLGSWIFLLWTKGEILFHPELFAFLLVGVIAESLWRIPAAVRLGSNRHRPVVWGYIIFSIIGLGLASLLALDYGLEGVAFGFGLVDIGMMVLAIWTLRGIIDISRYQFVLELSRPPVKEINQLLQKVFKGVRAMHIAVIKLNQRTIPLFLLPILTVSTVNVVGELMFSDITVLILAPLMFLKRNFNFDQPYLKKIMLLLGVWLIGVIISDTVNGTSIDNFLRGISAVIFFGLHLLVFFVLIDGKKERYLVAIIGVAFSFIIRWVSGSSEFSSADLTETPWKMGIGFAFTLLFTACIGLLIKRERVKGQVLLLLSPIHLYLNARSLFLTTALAGIASAFQLKVRSKKTRKMLLIGSLVTVVVVFPIATSIYGSLNEAGVFGEDAQEKYLQQTAGGEINIIIAGRSESLVSFNAISDSPLFGHGSWAESMHYYYMYLAHLDAVGKDVNWGQVTLQEIFLIPSHSMLLGTWVYHGIVGAVFWLYILYLTLKALGTSIGTVESRQLTSIELLVLFALLWDIFFSPFGQARRCIEAVYIVIACVILADAERYKETKKRKGN